MTLMDGLRLAGVISNHCFHNCFRDFSFFHFRGSHSKSIQESRDGPYLIPQATWYGVVFQDSASTTFPSGRVTLMARLCCAALSAISASCSAFSLVYRERRSSMYWGAGVSYTGIKESRRSCQCVLLSLSIKLRCIFTQNVNIHFFPKKVNVLLKN